MSLDLRDKAIMQQTQSGLPLTEQPYQVIANQLGLTEKVVIDRLLAMREAGVIRRIAAVPNHYKLGYSANGMSVWNIPDDKIIAYGKRIGLLTFVSHCYKRPRHPEIWDYNLFAMLHGRSRDDVLAHVEEIASILGEDNHGHEILFSKRILKKTGLRI